MGDVIIHLLILLQCIKVNFDDPVAMASGAPQSQVMPNLQ